MRGGSSAGFCPPACWTQTRKIGNISDRAGADWLDRAWIPERYSEMVRGPGPSLSSGSSLLIPDATPRISVLASRPGG